MKKSSLLTALLLSLLSSAASGESYTRTLDANGNWWDANAWAGQTWVNPSGSATATATITTSGASVLELLLDAPVTLSALNLNGSADLRLTGSNSMTLTAPATLSTAGNVLKFIAPLSATPPSTGIILNNGSRLEFSGSGNAFTGSGETFIIKNASLVFSDGTTSITGTGTSLNLQDPSARLVFTNTVVNLLGMISRPGNQVGGVKGTISIQDSARITINGNMLLAANDNSQIDVNHSGGELTITGTEVRVSHNASSNKEVPSIYTLSGGKLTLSKALFGVGRVGYGIFNMTGGEFSSLGIRAPQSTGQGLTTTDKGEVRLHGGIVTLGGNIDTSQASTGFLELGATTLKSSASWSITGLTNAALVSETVGTVFAPSASHTITVNSSLSGVGKLQVDGPGTVKLAAANTYTGQTGLRQGTLIIAHETGIPAMSDFTMTGGTLDLNGSSPITAKARSASFNGGTIVFNPVNAAAADKIELQGGALAVGADPQTTFNLTFAADPIGTYTLISGFSGFDGSLENLRLTTNLDPAFFTCSLALTEGNELQVVVGNATSNLKWAVENGIWSTSPTEKNWLDTDKEVLSGFENGDFTTFSNLDGIAAATIGAVGALNPAQVVFDATTTAYTFNDGGSGIITPASPVITADNGAPITFNVPFALTQPLTLGANSAVGIFAMLGDTPAGASSTYAANLTLGTGSSLVLRQGEDKTQILSPNGAAGAYLYGPGTLSKDGSGVLTINQSLPYFSGQLQVLAGTVRLGATSSSIIGSGTGMFGNTTYRTSAFYPVLINSGVVELTVNEVSGWNTGSQPGYKFAEIKGGGTLRKTSGGDENLVRDMLYSGNAFMVNASTAVWKLSPLATHTVSAGTTTFTATGSAGFRLVKGTAATNRLTFDVADTAAVVFEVPLVGDTDTSNSGFKKTGSGIFTFAAGTNYNAPTDVLGGALVIDAAASGNGAYTIGNGSTPATLKGVGSITGSNTVTIKAKASVETGLSIANLTMESGSRISVSADNRSLTVTGSVSADTGTIEIDPSNVSLSSYGKICDVLAWQAGTTAPTAMFELVGDKAKNFWLKWTDISIELYRVNGTLISIY